MKKTVSNKIKIYSTFMSIMIVIYHTGGILGFKECDDIIYIFERNLLNLCAPVALGYFFMISGFLFYYNLDDMNKIDKLKKRFLSLGIPFILWNVIEFCFLLFVKQLPELSVFDMLLGISFSPFNGPTWYIFALLLFFLFSFFLYDIFRNRWLSFILLILVMILALIYSFYFYNYTDQKLFWLERVIRYIPAFLVGVYISMHGKNIIDENYNKKKTAIVASIISCILIMIAVFLGVNEGNIICFIVLRLLPMCIWFVVYELKDFKTDRLIYNISFFVFLIHDMFIRISGYLIYKIISFENLSNNLEWIFIIRISIALVIWAFIYVFAGCIKKTSFRIYYFLTGNR